MPTRYLTADAVRAAEAATGPLLTDGTLMRRAAHGVAQAAGRELTERTGGRAGRTVGIVAGAGDNGGDALYAGAALARLGVRCTAVLLDPDRAHRAGLAAFRRAGGRVADSLPARPDLVIDGVVGIGGRGPLRPAAATVFAALAPDVPILAVDLPSGVDADTGVVHEPAVHADATVTFGVRRNAHLLAAPWCGAVTVADIGLPTDPEGEPVTDAAFEADGHTRVPRLWSLTDRDVGEAWPVPGPSDDKYSQGVVGIVAGSPRYPGAAILATGAAVTATSGMTRYAGAAHAEVVDHWPEVVAAPDLAGTGRVQAWVVGPGIGVDEQGLDVVTRLLATDLPVLVDADALSIVAEHPDLVAGRAAPTLLTPHAGEFARLAGAPVGPDRLGAVTSLAARLGVTVLLKGRITLVADADGTVYGNDAGSSWAATAGAGDVLAGMAGALLAAGLPPRWAGAMAARAHAVAADLASGGAPISASALLAALRPAIRRLRAGDAQ